MTTEIRSDGRVWCPMCEDHTQFLNIQKAMKVADASRRSIYRYIDEGKVFILKVAGHRTRVCGSCLLQPPSEGAD